MSPPISYSIEDRAEILKETLTHRRSVRQFKQEPLKPEHIRTILEAAIYAPSGSNSQNQRFLVVEDKQELEELGKIRFVWPYPTSGKIQSKKPAGLIGNAAAAIIIFADAAFTDGRDNGEYYIWESLEIQNCAASIENMLNMATALGVGSCWLSAGERMSHSRLISGKTWAHALARYDVPDSFKVQAIVILGYPHARLDEAGYPQGEKEHGATFWQETTRKPIEHYLVNRRGQTVSEQVNIDNLDRLKLYFASMVARNLIRLLRYIDHKIHDIEIKKALASILSDKKNSK